MNEPCPYKLFRNIVRECYPNSETLCEEEYQLTENIEVYETVDKKTIALYNKAKEKAIKVAADAKAPESSATESPNVEDKKKKKAKDIEELTTYKSKTSKKAKSTLKLPGNGASEIDGE